MAELEFLYRQTVKASQALPDALAHWASRCRRCATPTATTSPTFDTDLPPQSGW